MFPLNYINFNIIHFRNLTAEQKNLPNGLILFSVKDKDLLGYNNQYIGEAFLSFRDVQETAESIDTLPQVHLQLSRPTDHSKYDKTELFKLPNLSSVTNE